MPSGSPMGYGDVAGRVRTITQPVSVAGFFPLEFPEEYESFSIQIRGATIAARSVLVGFGLPEPGGQSFPATANDVFDPVAIAGVKTLTRTTRWVYVYVGTATPGAYLEVTGYQGAFLPRPPSAADIAAAMSGLVVSAVITAIADDAITWGASTPVAMSDVSAVVLAANALRRGYFLQNTGANPVALRYGAAAAVFASDSVMSVNQLEEQIGRKLYRGEIRGICGAGLTSTIRVREAT